MLKEGQLLCRMDYEKEREMLAAISPTPTESGKVYYKSAYAELCIIQVDKKRRFLKNILLLLC